MDYRKQKIEINPLTQKSEIEIADWKSQEISLVENAIRKHGQRITPTTTNRDKKINTLTQHSIEHFLNGNITVKIMQEKFPKDYEKFIRVVSLFEKKVTEICITNTGDNNLLYKQIEDNLKAKLKEAFGYIDQITIDRLTEQVLADWILRCPINFE